MESFSGNVTPTTGVFSVDGEIFENNCSDYFDKLTVETEFSAVQAEFSALKVRII